MLAEETKRIAGLRNLVVHEYWAVDDLRVYEEASSSRLEAIENFIAEVERHVEEEARHL